MSDASTSPSSRNNVNNPSTGTSNSSPSKPIKEKRVAQREQHLKFLDDLIRNVDIMIYCQLSILYYMDCSILKFLLRMLPHWFCFTPKPDIVPPTLPDQRPYIGTILVTNISCMLLHLMFSPQTAGDATRGYLHGGLVIDFIGQASPVSRWRLVAVDVLCLGLQMLMVGVTLEKGRMQGMGRIMMAGFQGAQDHSAEEAGILRSDPAVREGIELQPIRAASEDRTGGGYNRAEHDVLDQDLGQEDEHPLEAYYSGDQMIAKLHIIDTIRTHWKTRSVTANVAGAFGVRTAATFAGRRLTASFRARGR